MPRYFFHFRHGKDEVRDSEGTVLADPAAARREAMLTARDLVDHASGQIRPRWDGWSICVADARGADVLTLPLAGIAGETFVGRRPSGARIDRDASQGGCQVLHLPPAARSRPGQLPFARELDNAVSSRQVVTSALIDCHRFERRALQHELWTAKERLKEARRLVAHWDARRVAADLMTAPGQRAGGMAVRVGA